MLNNQAKETEAAINEKKLFLAKGKNTKTQLDLVGKVIENTLADTGVPTNCNDFLTTLASLIAAIKNNNLDVALALARKIIEAKPMVCSEEEKTNLRTKSVKVNEAAEKIDKLVNETMEDITEKIDNFESTGSGWIVDKFQTLDLKIATYAPLGE